MLSLDSKYNLTPDLPSLRYHGAAVPVFLWDDLANSTAFGNLLGINKSEYHKWFKSTYSQACTISKYIPWYNVESNKTDAYNAYCLSEVADIDFLDTEDFQLDTPRYLEGAVYHVSLDALLELDQHYVNGFNFNRTTVGIRPSAWATQSSLCYAYFNELEDLGDLDENETMYKVPFGIDLVPFYNHKRGEKDLYLYGDNKTH